MRRFCSIVTLVICLAGVAKSQAWRAQLADAEKAVTEERFEAAEALLKEALRSAEEGNASLEDRAQILDLLGDLYRDHVYPDLEEAERRYRLAYELRQTMAGTAGPGRPDLGASLVRFAELSERRGASAEAEAYFLRAIEARRRTFGETDLSVIELYERVGNFYLSQKRIDHARAAFREAVERWKTVFRGGAGLADVYDRIAGFYERVGGFSEAANYREQAFEVRAKVWGRSDLRTIYSLRETAAKYLEQRWYDEAFNSIDERCHY